MTLAMPTNPATITLDGVQLGGFDADGVQVVFNEISGWHDGAPLRADFEDRDNADGQFDAPVFKSGRVVTVTGWVAAPSRALAAAWIHRLKGMLGGGARGRFTVDDPDFGSLSALVRMSDPAKAAWNEARNRFTWQFSVTATDPLLYGPEQLLGPVVLPAPSGGIVYPLFDGTGKLEFGAPGPDGRITLVNPGTADTWPDYIVNGQLTGGFTITDVGTGRVIQFSDDVPDGNQLIIRSAIGRAFLNGTDRSGSLVVSQWTPVPKGGSLTVQLTAPLAAGQTGTFTARMRPAYE